MQFRSFPKMPARGGGERASPGGSFVALEKIHGAQLVIGVAAGAVRFGKRKAWLAGDEPFFGWQLLRAQLEAAAHAVDDCFPGALLWLYGELHGGSYPHPQVPAWPGLSPVQTGVWYGPQLGYSLFDVLLAAHEEDKGEFLAHSEVIELAQWAGLRTPPLLLRGPRTEVETWPVHFVTRVPDELHLPPLPGNQAEGLVIKPDRRMAPDQRTVQKRKLPEFNEARYGESLPWDPARPTLPELLCWTEHLVNPARLASARSKVGPANKDQLGDEVVLDTLVDLDEAFPGTLSAMPATEQAQLEQRIRERIAACSGT